VEDGLAMLTSVTPRRDPAASAPPPARTQTERRASSERLVLDAAAQLIAERGTTKASFAEIAAVAGCSHGLPHYLFGSKAKMLDALVVEFADQLSERFVAEAVGDATGLDALRKVLRAFVRSLDEPWAWTRALYVLLGESLGSAPELRPALNAYHERLRVHIGGWIDEGIAAGEVRADVDTRAAAVVVVGIVRGIGFQVLSDPEPFDVRSLAREAVAAVDRYLQE
jgi:AcrR family transcriptional regulator